MNYSIGTKKLTYDRRTGHVFRDQFEVLKVCYKCEGTRDYANLINCDLYTSKKSEYNCIWKKYLNNDLENINNPNKKTQLARRTLERLIEGDN